METIKDAVLAISATQNRIDGLVRSLNVLKTELDHIKKEIHIIAVDNQIGDIWEK